MKHVSFTLLRVLFLLSALTVWQAESAEAHGLDYPAAYQAASQSTHIKLEASASKAETVVAKSVSPSQEDNCKDGCCSSMSMGCFAAAIPPSSPDMHIVRDAFDPGLPELSLPPGPPFSLLRPPRFSA
jgi:hypothetical protein